MSTIDLRHGDCLELMKTIPDKSIDMILTDPPYGTTQCKWDVVIPFDLMWIQLNRIIKDNGIIILFGAEPFSSYLRTSNIKMFKYDWFWKKPQGTGFLNAKKQPLRDIEIASVFYKKQPLYNPQFSQGKPYSFNHDNKEYTEKKYGEYENVKRESNGKRYPKQLIEFNNKSPKDQGLSPTQKPIDLLEYLIQTYTIEGELILDFTMGSGSAGVACKNLNRNFIGIELDDKYFQIAKDRIDKA